MKLSVIIPCFNEQDTVAVILDRVKDEKTIEKEIIVVDDYSTDNSRKILENYKKDNEIKLILNDQNKGKGLSLIHI